MALTEIPIELSSTPSIVDGGNATAITIDSSENVGIGVAPIGTGLNIKANGNGYTDGALSLTDVDSDIRSYLTHVNGTFAISMNDGAADGITMSSAGAVTVANGLTLTDGNVVVANGHGIDFGATGNISGTSSELLSDYEEGTFTLTWTGSGGTANSTNTQFKYIKVGSLVTIFGNTVATLPNATGTLTLTGLPFVSRIETAGSVLYRYLTPPSGAHTLVAYVGTNSSTVSFIWSSAVNYTSLTSSHFNSNNLQDMYFSISYRTD